MSPIMGFYIKEFSIGGHGFNGIPREKDNHPNFIRTLTRPGKSVCGDPIWIYNGDAADPVKGMEIGVLSFYGGKYLFYSWILGK